jgi:glycosyltransferase involved in cell wall biosynthesis
MKKTITILLCTYNEEGNIDELYNRLSKIVAKIPKYNFEYLFVDNASSDDSVKKIKQIAKKNKKVKLIVNARNFGSERSHMHGLKQVSSDACIQLVSDLQDPPEVITDLVKRWEEGFKIVILVRKETEGSQFMFSLRKFYYRLLTKISEVSPIENTTGTGLIDSDVVNYFKDTSDPIPFFRGALVEIGFPIGKVYFKQSKRTKGVSTDSHFYNLYETAMLGITNHSKFPIRLLAIFGFILSVLSFILAMSYLFLKLFFWTTFDAGVAPLLIGLFFFGSIQMFFLGLIGEYIGTIHSRIRNMPLVVESERVNF